jgi:Tfp pilus assembly protein PilE
MKNTQLKGFSFVEILMIITILALISVVAYTSFGVRQNNAVNSKIQSEVISL